jgi:ADP-ribose pyrophosphatase YjhB (NUDIX family)
MDKHSSMVAGRDYIGVGLGALVFRRDGHVFLSRRAKGAKNERGYWEFPGGELEFGEKLDEGMRREFREEYGMDIRLLKLLGVFDHILEHERQHWVSITFIACHSGGVPRILEPQKCSAIGWFHLTRLPGPLTRVSEENLKAYRARYGSWSDWCLV